MKIMFTCYNKNFACAIKFVDLVPEHLGTYATCFGFGMNDEKFHAPDEFFRLKSYELRQRAYCKILYRVGDQK
jgi:acetylornithine deacetylase/succinyl-diaminopimelate desuccinylase-like protein